MSILHPPPRDPYERAVDTAAIGRILSQRLVNLFVAAWVNHYPEARDDVRELMHVLEERSREARLAGDLEEAGGQERARDRLVELWARASDQVLGSHTGLPQWDGVVDRLSVEIPAAPLD